MTLVVHVSGELPELWSSLDVLEGDPSPVLYLLYCHDFVLLGDPDGALPDGISISHLEHADDMVIISTSLRGLQHHLDHLKAWCGRNFMTINATKSKYMIFGPLPLSLPLPVLGRKHLDFVDTFTYIGCTFFTTSRNIFAEHYKRKAAMAARIANTILSLSKHVRAIPIMTGKTILRVCGPTSYLHVDNSTLALLEAVQYTFLR
ncbi:hypothetical protein M422DRAFT_242317 [Sphaerobolus stellatus SS14]|nr:hypothetical protein M422DRAFT_242317 [Sphaerobolus stellatus SS14]